MGSILFYNINKKISFLKTHVFYRSKLLKILGFNFLLDQIYNNHDCYAHNFFFPIVFFQSANSYLRDVTNYPGTIDVTNYTERIVQALADS